MVSAPPGRSSTMTCWPSSGPITDGENARDVIGGAAGRLRNDEPDGMIGIVAGGRGTRHAGDEESE